MCVPSDGPLTALASIFGDMLGVLTDFVPESRPFSKIGLGVVTGIYDRSIP